MIETSTAEGLAVEDLVIGSGFGGAAVACRLAEAGRGVAVLEGGKSYPLGLGAVNTTGHGTRTIRSGHFQIDLGYGMNVIRGRGVGGGSLHYYGVRLRAAPEIFDGPRWPRSITRELLDPYYDLAATVLPAGPIQPNPALGYPQRGATFKRGCDVCVRARGPAEDAPIAVYFGDQPRATPAGVDQTRCVYCGECLLGCPGSASFVGNVNARNLLTNNYLAIAKRHGARIFAEHFVERIRQADGGFEVDVRLAGQDDDPTQPGAPRLTVRARRVVLAAGTLGTVEILLKSLETLSVASSRVGLDFSGNGDFLIPSIVNTVQDVQPTSGPTITATCDFSVGDYSRGGNKITLQDLGLTPKSKSLLEMLTQPEEQIDHHRLGLLGMGTDAGNGVLRLVDGRVMLFWNPADSLTLYHQIIAAMRELAQVLGGDFAYPAKYDPITGAGTLTAHPLGGAIMADAPERGVVDSLGRVFGVPGLYIADGSIISSALAVNPSYTITALAERIAQWMLHGRELS